MSEHQSKFLTLPGIASSPSLPLPYDFTKNSGRNSAFDWCNEDLADGSLDQNKLQCRELEVHVVEDGAWRLRVGIDTADPLANLEVELWGPENPDRPVPEPDSDRARDGARGPLHAGGPGAWLSQRERDSFDSAEVFYYDPPPGIWRVRIIPVRVPAGTLPEIDVRMKLEAKPNSQDRKQLLLPDLRPELPLSFSFASTLSLKNCSPLDTEPPASHERCMRFAFGYQNAGLGPLELDFEEIPDPSGSGDTADVSFAVTQRVFRPADVDGSPDETPETYADNLYDAHPAGTATYHAAHAHFHYDDIIHAELYEVTAPGVLEPYGLAAKRGTCGHDQVVVDFTRFRDVQTQADSGSSCGAVGVPGRMRIGVSTGWGDVYAASLADNYVAFPDAPINGSEWVLRLSVDHDPASPTGLIRETDETNNVGFVHFRVSCDSAPGAACTNPASMRAVVLRRARGTDPWDPDAGPHLTEFGM